MPAARRRTLAVSFTALAVALAYAASPGGGLVRRAGAVSLTLTPAGTFGETNNALGATSDTIVRTEDFFTTLSLSAGLTAARGRTTHSLSYVLRWTRFAYTASANNLAHSLAWGSTFEPSGRATLALGGIASLMTLSTVAAVDPTQPTSGSTAVALAPTQLLTTSLGETLTYQMRGRLRGVESLTGSMTRSLGESTLPTTYMATVTGQLARSMGKNDYSLLLSVSDTLIQAAAGQAGAFNDGQVVTSQLLAGYHRDLTAQSSFDLRAGALALYGATYGNVAVGPAGSANLGYTRRPWFASLNISQQPSVNIYLGDAVIADTAAVRLSLPLNRAETLFVSGTAAYTYARRVTPTQHFVTAARSYDLVTVGASATYHLLNKPLFFSADYMLVDQRGSLSDGLYIPSTIRRTVTVNIGGTFHVIGDGMP